MSFKLLYGLSSLLITSLQVCTAPSMTDGLLDYKNNCLIVIIVRLTASCHFNIRLIASISLPFYFSLNTDVHPLFSSSFF